jgi:fluoroquinolone transport system permease protein
MRRLLATIRCDARLQLRNGFYYATAFVLVMWAAILSQLPALNLGWLLPAIVSNELVIVAFYFIGGLVLLEKGEGTLEAQVVTPLRTWEYLASKVITLAGLGLVQNVILVALIYGPGFDLLPLAVGIALAAALYVLAGFVAVTRHDSINEYLLPSALYTGLLMVPLLYVAGWDHWLLYLHPLQAPLVLMRAAFEPVAPWQIAYAVLYSGLWVGLASFLSQRTLQRFVIARAGSS